MPPFKEKLIILYLYFDGFLDSRLTQPFHLSLWSILNKQKAKYYLFIFNGWRKLFDFPGSVTGTCI